MNDCELKGLPLPLESERLVLGSIMQDDSLFVGVAGTIQAEDFGIEKHRLIFGRMVDLHQRGEKIDRITVYNELLKRGQAEACEGLSYLISLDDGLPKIGNVDAYTRIVRDKSLLRKIVFASQGIMNRCLNDSEEPATILESANRDFLGLSEQQGDDGIRTVREILDEHGGINRYFERSGKRGLETGFYRLDDMTNGLRGGELFLLGARPRMGKTALALNIAANVIDKYHGELAVPIFSLEMSKEALLDRMICSHARVSKEKLRSGGLNEDERARLMRSASRLDTGALFSDKLTSNVMEIYSKVRRIAAKRKLGLVVIDYLQLMAPSERSESQNQRISDISRTLKLMGMDLKVPLLVLSQLSRACEVRPGDHRPMLSDLRDSGSIEQDADIVGFLYREEVYKPDRTDLYGVADLTIEKQREGPVGRIPLVWQREIVRFDNRAEEMA